MIFIQDISSIESAEFAPYIVLLSPDLFGGSMLTKLKNTGTGLPDSQIFGRVQNMTTFANAFTLFFKIN